MWSVLRVGLHVPVQQISLGGRVVAVRAGYHLARHLLLEIASDFQSGTRNNVNCKASA